MGFQSQSQSLLSSPMLDDDDDFQIPLSLTQASIRKPLKLTNSNSTRRPSKKPKRSGKENVNVPGPTATQSQKSQLHDFESSDLIGCCTSSSLDSIRSSIVDCTDSTVTDEKKGLMTARQWPGKRLIGSMFQQLGFASLAIASSIVLKGRRQQSVLPCAFDIF